MIFYVVKEACALSRVEQKMLNNDLKNHKILQIKMLFLCR